MKIINPILLELPKYKRKSGHILCTLNNIPKWYRYNKTKIKQEYKEFLSYVIPEPETTYEALTIHYRIVRHNNRRIDKDNVIFALKWLSDYLESIGYIKDDNVVNFVSYDTIVNKNIPETMLEIYVTDQKQEWSK
jgi:hypothetical protein